MMMMVKTGPENDLDHTTIIRQHYVYLLDSLDVKSSGLVYNLYQAEVLSIEEMQSVVSERKSVEQIVKLLSMLSRKSKVQFDKFLDALNETGQQHVCSHITSRQGMFIAFMRSSVVACFCLIK